MTTADINGNTPAFTERTALMIPDGSSSNGGLDAQGLANLKAWGPKGGTYVGLRDEGTRVARAGRADLHDGEGPAGRLHGRRLALPGGRGQ